MIELMSNFGFWLVISLLLVAAFFPAAGPHALGLTSLGACTLVCFGSPFVVPLIRRARVQLKAFSRQQLAMEPAQ